MKVLIGLILYVAIATWTVGAMNATMRAEWYKWPTLCASDARFVARDSRNEFVFAVIAGVIPPGWVAALLITGAYQDGWSLKTGPACDARGLI